MTDQKITTTNSGNDRYLDNHNIRGRTKSFYVVACPYCRALIGKPCMRELGTKWSPPHAERIKASGANG